MTVLAGALKVVGLLVCTAVCVSGLRENETSFFGNIIPLCKSIIRNAIHTKTQHSNLCTFRFIPCRYMFRSVILTISRDEMNLSVQRLVCCGFVWFGPLVG